MENAALASKSRPCHSTKLCKFGAAGGKVLLSNKKNFDEHMNIVFPPTTKIDESSRTNPELTSNFLL